MKTYEVLRQLRACALTWVPEADILQPRHPSEKADAGVCLLGNVRAGDIVRAMDEMLELLKQQKD